MFVFSFFFLSFSLWGKFGERQNKPVTRCITQPADLFRLLDDPVFQISAVRICSEDVMEVVTTTAEDECERSFKTNVFVAAFTTSLARLKLYEALDFLDQFSFLGNRARYGFIELDMSTGLDLSIPSSRPLTFPGGQSENGNRAR